MLGVEGENKADAAGELGIAAFSFKELDEGSVKALAGLRVVVWPDRDDEGRRLGASAGSRLRSIARSVDFLRPPPELLSGGDIIDAIDLGWDAPRIADLHQTRASETVQRRERQENPNEPRILDGAALMRLRTEPVAYLVNDIITTPGVWMLHGNAKAGKTLLALSLSMAVQGGAPFLDYFQVSAPTGTLFLNKTTPSGAAAVKGIVARSRFP